MAFDPRLRSPKERPLFVLGLVFSAVVWLLLIISMIGILYGLLISASILFAHALFLARLKGDGVRLSEHQLPMVHSRYAAACARLGLSKVPEIYVLQSHGALNAFATRFLSRDFVIVYSDLVDHCEDPRQLDFVLGHELGYLAAGHLKWNAVLLPFRLVPWLGAAYSRACEYTCDRVGFFVAGDSEQAMRGLCVLAAGGKLASQMNLTAFMNQRMESGRFWAAISELVSSHPFLCKRVAALHELTAPGTVAPVRRNPLAYPLAPVLGVFGAGGGAFAFLIPVYVLGILAAIAIPHFQRYAEEARAAAAMQNHPSAGQDLYDDYDDDDEEYDDGDER